MGVIRWLAALACIAIGALFGALNRQPIAIDIGIRRFATTSGIALLCSLAAGIAAGMLVATLARAPRRRDGGGSAR